MDDAFKIYVEQLRDGREEKIDEQFSSDFLEVDEPHLRLKEPIHLTGLACVADTELLLRWQVSTAAQLTCSICNEWVTVPIVIKEFCESIPLEEIPSGVYHFKELLREAILLEIPPFVECHGGCCPKREEYRRYFKEESGMPNEQAHHPFADFDWPLH